MRKINYPLIVSDFDGTLVKKDGAIDEYNKEMIKEYVDYLSIGISNIINIFEPDAICIGGSFSEYGSIFYEPLKEALLNFVLNDNSNHFYYVYQMIKDNYPDFVKHNLILKKGNKIFSFCFINFTGYLL